MIDDGPTSLFISYGRRDSSFVDRLEADLQADHCSTKVDRRNVEIDQSWKQVLRDMIDHSGVMLIVLSPAAVSSRLVQMEYRYALSQQKTILALEYQPCLLPDDLKHVQSISLAASKADYGQGLKQLLAMLKDHDRKPPLATEASYREGVESEERVKHLREQAQQAQQAGAWRRASGCWQALLELGEQNDETRKSLERSLCTVGKDASARGAWEEAMSTWEMLLKYKPEDTQAASQLRLAWYNQQYAEYYEDALQCVKEHAHSAAEVQLRKLWHYAPYYGDPAGLALKVALAQPKQSPATFEEDEQIPARQEQENAKKRRVPASSPAQPPVQPVTSSTWQSPSFDLLPAPVEQLPLVEFVPFDLSHPEVQKRQARQEATAQQELGTTARERLIRCSPGWFIHELLQANAFLVWCSVFFLLVGLGGTAGIVFQSWPLALATLLVTACLAYILGHHRVVHRVPGYLQERAMQATYDHRVRDEEKPRSQIAYLIMALAIVIICSIVTFLLMRFVIQISYEKLIADQFLWIGRSWWPGRQIKAGLLIGAVVSLTTTLLQEDLAHSRLVLLRSLHWSGQLSLVAWFICGLVGLMFDLGWGLGAGWDVSLLGLLVGCVAGVGLGSSAVIWSKGRPIL